MKKYLILISLILSMTLTGCTSILSNKKEDSSLNSELSELKTPLELNEELIHQPDEQKKDSTVTFCALGDNLFHSTVYNHFKKDDGTYDFSSLYFDLNYDQSSQTNLNQYDLAVVNQETVLVDDNKVSSYPCFGTPKSIASALDKAGFDIVLQATNHTMDKGIDGVKSTLDTWKEYPNITVLGIHETKEDADTIDIVEKNNIKFAMFNYTYGTNGINIPSQYDYMIDTLDDKEKFLSDVTKVKDENLADFTICFLHIGTEYTYEPTTYQKDYVNDLIDAGADVIICAHPHVVEPYGYVTTENGNTGLVYYSCGNFISGQDELPRILGGLARMTFRKTSSGKCSIEAEEFIPIVCHRTSNSVQPVYLEDYTNDLASTHAIPDVTVEKLWDLWDSIMSKPIN